MVKPPWVRLSSLANGAPLSTASTRLRQAAAVAGGNSAVGCCASLIAAKCHARRCGPTSAIGARVVPRLARRELLYAGRVHARQRITDPDPGDDAIRGDFG